MVTGQRRKVPAEECAVAVAVDPGEQVDDHVAGFGWLRGIPVVGNSLGDAAELDDGEFGGEPALEGADAAADFGEGRGVTSGGVLQGWNRLRRNRHGRTRGPAAGWTGLGIGEACRDFVENPLIASHLLSFE